MTEKNADVNSRTKLEIPSPRKNYAYYGRTSNLLRSVGEIETAAGFSLRQEGATDLTYPEGYSDGQYYLYMVDSAAKTFNLAKIPIRLDNTAPIVTLTAANESGVSIDPLRLTDKTTGATINTVHLALEFSEEVTNNSGGNAITVAGKGLKIAPSEIKGRKLLLNNEAITKQIHKSDLPRIQIPKDIFKDKAGNSVSATELKLQPLYLLSEAVSDGIIANFTIPLNNTNTILQDDIEYDVLSAETEKNGTVCFFTATDEVVKLAEIQKSLTASTLWATFRGNNTIESISPFSARNNRCILTRDLHMPSGIVLTGNNENDELIVR